MYAALNKKGQLIYAQDAVEKQKYFCSQCNRPVKLVVTTKKTFFRHESANTNSVNERLKHVQGKFLIATTLTKILAVNVELEHFLPEIQQRPDLWVNQHLAVEYQCAKIDVQTLEQRVSGYRQAGVQNLWILGGDYLANKIRREHLKFINYSSDLGYYLLMLDSQKQKFTFFYQIEFVGPFSQIVSQRQVFYERDFEQIFTFRPLRRFLQPIMMNDFLLQKLRRRNDPQSQKIKLAFYIGHRMTVEESLRKQTFSTQPPIYVYPAWQRICGQSQQLLKQPLLKISKIKKPPQK